jgi:hypothetical protein
MGLKERIDDLVVGKPRSSSVDSDTAVRASPPKLGSLGIDVVRVMRGWGV